MNDWNISVAGVAPMGNIWYLKYPNGNTTKYPILKSTTDVNSKTQTPCMILSIAFVCICFLTSMVFNLLRPKRILMEIGAGEKSESESSTHHVGFLVGIAQ